MGVDNDVVEDMVVVDDMEVSDDEVNVNKVVSEDLWKVYWD